MLKSDQIQCFIAISELGSYHKAAEALHKSQPAITKAIQNLEQRLGIKLFRKDTYRATLTEEGQIFYQKAKPIMAQFQQLADTAQSLKIGHETHINIAIDCIYPDDELAKLYKKFNKNFPNTELHIFTENLGGALERLLDGDADLAITENLGSYHTIEAKPLIKIKLVPVATPDYFEQHHEAFEDVHRLQENRQIILRDSSRLLEKYNFGVVEGTRSWSVTELNKKKHLILSGFGWGRLPSHMVEKEIKQKTLMELTYPHTQTKTATLSLLRRNDKEPGPVAKSLWA